MNGSLWIKSGLVRVNEHVYFAENYLKSHSSAGLAHLMLCMNFLAIYLIYLNMQADRGRCIVMYRIRDIFY